jgi:hypothetical protein
MEMNDDLYDMALNRYGYGRWEAPYWFIGMEEGMDSAEKDLKCREKAWRDLGSRELDDCRDFHNSLFSSIEKKNRLHRKVRPALQPTWNQLIRALMIFLGGLALEEDRREYQRDNWGSLHGDSCVIELSGLAARNLKELSDRKSYRDKRINFIRKGIRDHNPKFVIVYGTSDREPWEKISKGAVLIEEAKIIDDVGRTFAEFKKTERTILALTQHPTAFAHKKIENWGKLGATLRSLVDGSSQA